MFDKFSFYNGSNFSDWQTFFESIITNDTRGVVLFVGEDTPFFSYEEVQPILNKYSIPICGGIFPGIIYKNDMLKSGVLGISFNKPIQIEMIENLDSYVGYTHNTLDQCTPHIYLVLVDGLAPGIGNFLEKLFACSTKNVKFIGGGAGRLSLEQAPLLFTQNKFWAGGSIIVKISAPIGIGVQHGWSILQGPLIVNASENHYLYELNWKPALLGYQEVIKKTTGEDLTIENFFSIARKYPFGMVRSDNSLVVRDTISIHDKEVLRLVGEVPENSILTILKGDANQLINSAGQAVKDAYLDYYIDYGAQACKGVLVIDCISRALFLEDQIFEEIAMINEANEESLPIIGFFSLGEVASIGDRYLELFNKTTVIGVG